MRTNNFLKNNQLDFNEIGVDIEILQRDCIFPSWKTQAMPLLVKAHAFSQKPPFRMRLQDTSDSLNVEKLFRERECNSSHMNDALVKPIFIRAVLNRLRLNPEIVSPSVVRRVITKFCLNGSYASCRVEAYDYLAEIVERVPPISIDARQFWMDVVVSSEKKMGFNRALAAFGCACMELFCCSKPIGDGNNKPVSPLAYREFLLNFLELDYAALHALGRSPTLIIGKSDAKLEHMKRSRIKIDDVPDLKDVPLAMLLIVSCNEKGNYYWLRKDDELFNDMVDEFIGTEDPRARRLYARLIGLLLDVITFIFYPNFYEIVDGTACEDSLPMIPMTLKSLVEVIRNRLDSAHSLDEFQQLIAAHTPFVYAAMTRRDVKKKKKN